MVEEDVIGAYGWNGLEIVDESCQIGVEMVIGELFFEFRLLWVEWRAD